MLLLTKTNQHPFMSAIKFTIVFCIPILLIFFVSNQIVVQLKP